MELSPLVFALAAGLGNLAGAAALVQAERRQLAAIGLALAFGAGFMLALVLLGVLPRVFGAGSAPAVAGSLVLGGYLLVHLTQHVLTPHFHFGEETHAVPRSAGYSALAGLSLHAFFDGVAITSGLLASRTIGLLFFLAILLHKLPEGVAVASVMLASGRDRRHALGAGAVLGAATLLGALLTGIVAPLARHGLALAAGVTLYVAASNLIPEVQAARGARVTLAFLGGVAALVLLGGLGAGGGG